MNFREWWTVNHPWDWFTKERNGEPMSTFDRLLVAKKCEDTWNAALAEAARVCREAADRYEKLALTRTMNRADFEQRAKELNQAATAIEALGSDHANK